MTSQLRVDRISPANNSEIIIDGLEAPESPVKAWVNFNGAGTVSIRASANVSSIADNGTGDYTVNFTNPMPDNNYSVSICLNHPSSMVSPLNTERGYPTTSGFHIYTLNSSFLANDAAVVMAQIIR